MTPKLHESYLGDGLYAHFDGWHIWLTTQEGMAVALEPVVLAALFNYIEKLKRLGGEKEKELNATRGGNG